MALCAYTLISCLFVDHGVSITRNLSGEGSDPYDSPWFLAWWPWAMTHHQNLLFTHLVWQPLGVSLLWITSIPALAILGWPITALWGPGVTYNVLVILAPILSAWLMFFVCLRISHDSIAAFIGGFLFGFSAYEMAQDAGALNLSFTCLVPAILLVALRRFDGEVVARAAIVQAAALLIVQFLISIEIFAMMFVFGSMAWAVGVACFRQHRTKLIRFLYESIFVGLIVLVAISSLLLSMWRHADLIDHPAIWPYYFTADVTNIFVPGPGNIFGTFFEPISSHFKIGLQEQDAYLGLPIVAIIWLFARSRWGEPLPRLLVGMFLICLLASLGPGLWINGNDTGIILPWAIFVHLPLLGSALPCRFAMFASLAAALIVSLWSSNKNWRILRLMVAGLACLTTLPSPHPWRPMPISTFFQPGILQAELGAHPKIMILPFSINGASSFWQAENQFGFAQTGGYLGFPPAPMQHYAAVQELFGNRLTSGFKQDFRLFCQATGTQYVVAGPGTGKIMLQQLDQMGWKSWRDDDVEIFAVPQKS